jgi:hypothetical protein
VKGIGAWPVPPLLEDEELELELDELELDELDPEPPPPPPQAVRSRALSRQQSGENAGVFIPPACLMPLV